MLLLLVITSLLHSVFSVLIVPFQHLDFVLGVCKCFLLCQELCLATRAQNLGKILILSGRSKTYVWSLGIGKQEERNLLRAMTWYYC